MRITQNSAIGRNAVIAPVPVGVEPGVRRILIEVADIIGRVLEDHFVGHFQREAVVRVALHNHRVTVVKDIGHVTAGKNQRPSS